MSEPEQHSKSIKAILANETGGKADKLRDHLGETLTITSFEELTTSGGEAVQFLATGEDGSDVRIWATSVVAKQLRELDEQGYLPARLRLAATTSQAGREYFTLEDPD